MLPFLQHLVNALCMGSIYALIALGYSLVYGILRLINFAHGDVYMVGAFAGYWVARELGVAAHPSIGALALVMAGAMLTCSVLGLLIERVAYRPLRQAAGGRARGGTSGSLNVLISAIGVGLFLEAVMQLIAGADPRPFPTVLEAGAGWDLGGLRVEPLQLLVLAIAGALMFALQLVIYRTRLGRAMRAVSEDAATAELLGIPSNRVIAWTFVIGSALAGAAGVLVGLIYPRLDPWMGVMPGVKAFIAAVLGGIGSIGGAVAGAMILALAEEMLAGYGAPGYRDAAAFAILILTLLWRPAGLFGRPWPQKV